MKMAQTTPDPLSSDYDTDEPGPHHFTYYGGRDQLPDRSGAVEEVDEVIGGALSRISGSTQHELGDPHSSGESSGLGDSRGKFAHSVIENSVLLHSFSRESGTSWVGGVLIMANVCIGMGLLNFPRAIAESGGLLPSMIIASVFVVLIMLSLAMTAYCCRYYGCVNYQDMVTTNCGPFFGMLCKICLLLETMGACIVKLVVFADQLDRIMRIAKGNHFMDYWYLRRTFIMPVISSLTVLPMCLLRNFQIFKYTSILGIIAALYISFGVAMGGYFTNAKAAEHVEPVTGPPNVLGLFPLMVFLFHGHAEAPVVFCCLRKNRIFYFMRMVYAYLLLAVVIYFVAAVFGYLTFHKDVDVDLLLSYRSDNWMVNVGMILVILKLFTSFPVVFYVLRSVVDEMWRRFLHCHCLERGAEVRRVFLTLVLFYIIVIVAALVPDMSSAIALIGGISCNFAFTFPGLCCMVLHLKRDQTILKNRIRVYLGALFVVLGAFMTGANTTIAIQQYLSGKKGAG